MRRWLREYRDDAIVVAMLLLASQWVPFACF